VVEGLRDAGIAVDVAHDGLDAAAKLNVYPYDVVVLDRDLPGLHGDALCTSITDSQADTMVLMLTAADSPAERVFGLKLDPLTHTATRDGRALDLSNKELPVLEALLEASPGVLSAEQLLLKAWDENADPFTQTVKVTIGRLRRKLGEPPIIHTASGIGYRL
jgi:DNA-binding response OmpR family regulator